MCTEEGVPSRVSTSVQGWVSTDGLSDASQRTRASVAFELHSGCFAVVFAPQRIDEST